MIGSWGTVHCSTRERYFISYISMYRFVEFGEFKGNLYGTTYASIRAVISSGRICLLCPHTQVNTQEAKATCIYMYIITADENKAENTHV